MNNDIVIFKNGELELEVSVSKDRETVWLSQKQMSQLFKVSTDNVGLHIKNILDEQELDSSTAEESSVVQKEGNRFVKRKIKDYNLDMILAVGYRVKSPNGIVFRKWATSILKDYMLKGYAINQKRLEALDRTVKIQSRIIASTLDLNEKEVLDVVEKAILLFREQGLTGERFADTIARLGFENVQSQLLANDLLDRKTEILGAQVHLVGGATC